MKKLIIPALFASSILLTGCLEQKTNNTTSAPAVKKEDAVAVVNGKYISKQALEDLKQQVAKQSHGRKIPEKQLLEELIRREIIVQKAEQEGLDKTPEFQQKMNEIKTSLLTQLYLQDYLKKHPITDDELKAEYDSLIGQQDGTEYKARHILLKSKEEAEKVIAELNKGADFTKLAKEKSTGPSAPQGGDLGWFTADRMVKPFSEAVAKLEDGKYTQEPVKTQFGWHVILREKSRKQTPPPFEAVKEQLKPMLQRKKVQQMLDSLKQQAKVEVLLPQQVPADQQPAPAATDEKAKSAVTEAADKAKQAAGDIEKTAAETVETAKQAASDVKQAAEQAAQQAKQAATETVESAKQEATQAVDKAANAAKDAVNSITQP